MWLKDLYNKGRELTSDEYHDARERDSLLNILLEDVLHLQRYTVLTDPFQDIGERDCELFLGCARRLASGEPVQYVVGRTEFYGRRFNVTPDVLIPRPETEQLCREVIERTRLAFPDKAGCVMESGVFPPELSRLRVLDLCTGSGCIAWTLALELPGSCVVGVDISSAALEVAKTQNFTPPRANDGVCCPRRPSFVEYDVLRGPDSFDCDCGGFDIIVSNPPYVRESERLLMRRNVLDHEPPLALFVPDGNPLKFYKAIRDWARRLLVPGGLLFLEGNEALSEETEAFFSDFSEHGNFSDCFGKPRFTFARK